MEKTGWTSLYKDSSTHVQVQIVLQTILFLQFFFSFGQPPSNPSNTQTLSSNAFGSFNLNQPSSQPAPQPAQPSPYGFGTLGTSYSNAPVSTNSGMFGSLKYKN